MENRLLREGLAELIGTFMLVLVGAGAVTVLSASRSPVAADVIIAALAHGLILIAIIATYGSISGAHVNPAVTLGLLVARKLNLSKAAVYWAAQFVGAILAALVLRYIFPEAITLGQTVPAAGIDSLKVIVIEGLLTFFLVSTVIQVAAFGKAEKLAPVAVAIGFTLAACILFGGPLTGGSLNPARTLGPGLVSGDTREIFAYLIGIFGGGALAGLVHTTLFPEHD